MMTFVDTSALLALLDGDEEHHPVCADMWRDLLRQDTALVTTNYVLVESFALVQSRLGIAALRTLVADFLPLIDVVWLDREVHERAVGGLLTAGKRKLSLVNCASFETMRRLSLYRVFTLDDDFTRQGFQRVPA